MCPSQDVFRIMFILKLSLVVKYVAPTKIRFRRFFLSSQYLMHTSALNICKKQLSFYLIRLSPRCRLFSVLSSLLHIFSRYILVVHTIVAQMHRAKWCLGTSQSQSDIFCLSSFSTFCKPILVYFWGLEKWLLALKSVHQWGVGICLLTLKLLVSLTKKMLGGRRRRSWTDL